MLRRVGKCMKKYSAILLSAVLLILSLSVSAFAAKNTPYPPPTQNFFVNDFADCINETDEQKMQSMAFTARTSEIMLLAWAESGE